MNSHAAADSAKATAASAEPRMGFVGSGTSLDWNSPLRPLVLAVELPFWLLMPETTLCVSVGGFTTDVDVINDGIALQVGEEITRHNQNTVFIGSMNAANDIRLPAKLIPIGGMARSTRTLLRIKSHCIEDAALAFFQESGRRFQDGRRYFASLAIGHLPVVNKIINAYRMAAIDPYASEVTAWDVPVWFVGFLRQCVPVALNDFLVNDRYPVISRGPGSDDHKPIFATSREAVGIRLSQNEPPGEIEMLDGWSLFHRGRYGDSIRSFVTAIEVLVEAEIRRLLTISGKPPEEIDSCLEKTRGNFDDRLRDYCMISGRRIPGPILSPIPYINGLRLQREQERTRKLRHKIVHHGHRLDHTFEKPMLRAAETTSWLFDWLTNGGDFETRRRAVATLAFATRTDATPFRCEVRDGTLVVVPIFPESLEHGPSAQEIPVVVSFDRIVHNEQILLKSICRQGDDGKDVEHFTLMAFYELGLNEYEDSPPVDPSRQVAERFRIKCCDKTCLVFVIDTHEILSGDDIDRVSNACQELRQQGVLFDHTIIIANENNGREWHRRGSAIDDELAERAFHSGTTVVYVPGLARIVLGVLEYGWLRRAICNALTGGGVFDPAPPGSVLLGTVYHFWGGSGVVGVQLESDVLIEDGDSVVMELPESFYTVLVAGPRTDDSLRVTFSIPLGRGEVPLGCRVFRITMKDSLEGRTDNA